MGCGRKESYHGKFDFSPREHGIEQSDAGKFRKAIEGQRGVFMDSASAQESSPMRAAKQRTCGGVPPIMLFVPQGNVGNRRICEQTISHYQHIITTVSLVKALRDDLAIGRFERVVHMVCHHQTERAHQPWGITLEGDGADALCPMRAIVRP